MLGESKRRISGYRRNLAKRSQHTADEYELERGHEADNNLNME